MAAKTERNPGMVALAYNPNTREAERGGSQILAQPRLQSDTPSQNRAVRIITYSSLRKPYLAPHTLPW
jgi:hypothetical protein